MFSTVYVHTHGHVERAHRARPVPHSGGGLGSSSVYCVASCDWGVYGPKRTVYANCAGTRLEAVTLRLHRNVTSLVPLQPSPSRSPDMLAERSSRAPTIASVLRCALKCRPMAAFSAPPSRLLCGYANSVTELIGRTPMVRLNRVIGDDCVAANVLVKLEMQNPGGSVKVRAATRTRPSFVRLPLVAARAMNATPLPDLPVACITALFRPLKPGLQGPTPWCAGYLGHHHMV